MYASPGALGVIAFPFPGDPPSLGANRTGFLGLFLALEYTGLTFPHGDVCITWAVALEKDENDLIKDLSVHLR